MGFDQYHEPPQELPEKTRTFARLCASLTEEAEAIGWYEQRLAVERDPEARAVMADAVGEEYKHFCMDLEFLLRRKPKWREIARGVLFQEGDIVEHGESAEAAAARRRLNRAALPRSRVVAGRHTGHRKPKGGAMSHLLRQHAPITQDGWKTIDEEARERLLPGLAGTAAGRFLRTPRLGALGYQPRACRGRRREPDQGRRGKSPRRAFRWSSCVRDSRSLARSSEPATAAPRMSTSTRSTLPLNSIVEAENLAVFHAWPKAGIGGISERSPHDAIHSDGRCREAIPSTSRAPWSCCCANGIAGPYGLGARARGIHACRGERRARRLPAARSPAQDPRGPDRVGAGRKRGDRVEHARWRLQPSSPARISRLATSLTTATWSRSIWRSPSASACSRPRQLYPSPRSRASLPSGRLTN